ncbi:hypothetical protein Dimus_012296 [Dionaea muscipula]
MTFSCCMPRHGLGIRFLTCAASASAASTQRRTTSWDPIRSLNLTHPILLHLENCNSRHHFKQILAQMMRNDLATRTFPMSRLLYWSAISHPENLDLAFLLFDHFTPSPSLFVYNTMISACSSSSFKQSSAFRLYSRMLRDSVYPDKHTLLHLLQACSFLWEGKQVHCRAIVSGLVSYDYLGNSLIKFYMEDGEMGLAQKVFDQMPDPGPVSFNIMIVEHAKRGYVLEAVENFHRMVDLGLDLDVFTMLGMLICCGQSRQVRVGKAIHAWIEKRNDFLGLNVTLCNALLDMYVKCKDLECARIVFTSMRQRNAISWNTIIAGYTKVGDLELASNFFYEMPERDLVTWNTLVAGYAQQGDCLTLRRLLKEMVAENVQPDEWTMVNLASAAAETGEFHLGRSVHGWVIRMQKNNTDAFLTSALIDMYSKCGNIEKAFRIFQGATQKDVALWTTMITGFAFHGNGQRALELFFEMQQKKHNILPNHVTLVAVLSACSHSGLVDQGLDMFTSMKDKLGIEPRIEHYGCLVDLLVRSGRLELAMRIIKTMPMKPGRSIWGSVLGACNGEEENTLEIARLASSELLKLEPEKEGGYVVLSNIYASCGKWKYSDEVRETMESRGVKKTAGSSSLVVDGVQHEFWAADDMRHRSWPDLQSILNHLRSQMRMRDDFLFYCPD